MDIQRIEFAYVAVETAPLKIRYDSWNDHEEQCLISEYEDLPEPYAAALRTVCDAVDNCRCWDCQTGTGYVLHEDDDEPHLSGVRWHPVWLIREGEHPVAVLCEDCVPQVPEQPWVESN